MSITLTLLGFVIGAVYGVAARRAGWTPVMFFMGLGIIALLTFVACALMVVCDWRLP